MLGIYHTLTAAAAIHRRTCLRSWAARRRRNTRFASALRPEPPNKHPTQKLTETPNKPKSQNVAQNQTGFFTCFFGDRSVSIFSDGSYIITSWKRKHHHQLKTDAAELVAGDRPLLIALVKVPHSPGLALLKLSENRSLRATNFEHDDEDPKDRAVGRHISHSSSRGAEHA